MAIGHDPYTHPVRLQGGEASRASYHENFLTCGYIAGSTTTEIGGLFSEGADAGRWLVTVVGTSETIVVLDNQPGGVVRMTSGASDDDEENYADIVHDETSYPMLAYQRGAP